MEAAVGFDFGEAAAAYFDVVPVWLYLVAISAYYPIVRWGQRRMARRTAFDLKVPLFAWNVFMSLASAYVAVRLVLEFDPFSHEFRVCDQSVMTKPAAWFILLFNVTKPIEWVDTLFLVLRKRRVIFLHWIHHLVTALYCLHATIYSGTADTTGVQFATMNVIVHAIMYAYYAITCVTRNQKLLYVQYYINGIQALQMVAGLIAIVRSTLMCPRTLELNWHGMAFAALMYTFYAYMFIRMLHVRLTRSDAPAVRASKK